MGLCVACAVLCTRALQKQRKGLGSGPPARVSPFAPAGRACLLPLELVLSRHPAWAPGSALSLLLALLDNEMPAIGTRPSGIGQGDVEEARTVREPGCVPPVVAEAAGHPHQSFWEGCTCQGALISGEPLVTAAEYNQLT